MSRHLTLTTAIPTVAVVAFTVGIAASLAAPPLSMWWILSISIATYGLCSWARCHQQTNENLRRRLAMASDLAILLEQVRAEARAKADENVNLRRELIDAQRTAASTTRKADPDRGDPVARALVARLLNNFEDLCMIGPDGCQTHFHEKNCSVAWLRSWVEGHLASPGMAGLAITMTGQRDATTILGEALTTWADTHEAAGAHPGPEGQVWRHKTRLARNMAASLTEGAP